MQAAAKRENLTIVQALRGIAALWVVLFHANEGGHIPSLRQALPDPIGSFIFDAGHFGVAIFFALSGFVISYGLDRSSATLGFFGTFILRRSIRLDPPYWASMILAVALIAISGLVKHENFTLPDTSSVLSHLFYLQVILDKPEINSVYWTLTYEVQFYLFFVGAIVARFYLRHIFNTPLYIAIDIALFLCAISSALGFFKNVHPGLFFPLWSSFYIGVLAHTATLSKRKILAFIALFVAMLFNGEFSIVSAFTATFLLIAMTSGWAKSGMNWRWLQFLGGISYSLYLVHNPVTGAVSFVLNKIPLHGTIIDLLKLVMIVISSVIAAYIFWFVIEKKTHDVARSITATGSPTSWLKRKMRRE
ncbi:acyltransferase [Sphingomonas cynarae]